MADLKPGDWIEGEYRIRRIFGGSGKSGMGVVYLVEGRSSEEPFVLKTFQRGENDEGTIARFKQEADAWVRLGSHPNVVRCFWAREINNQLFVAAEYVAPDLNGRNTLSQHITNRTTPIQRQVEWVAQFCYGMKHTLARGVTTHRDIKPDNLMITGAGRLKITDYGLAKTIGGDAAGLTDVSFRNAGLTSAGAICGTHPFMAPEQFLDSSTVDRRADIYSFGVVLYLILSGGIYPVSPDQRDEATHGQTVAWALAHIRQPVRSCDAPLMAICAKCLEKDRERRFRSYDELTEALSAFCRKERIPIPPEEQPLGTDFDAEYAIAMSLGGTGKEEQAVTKLREMARRWPDECRVFTELGRVLMELNRCEEAVEATQRSLSLDSSRTAPWNNLGSMLARLQRFDEAKGAFGKALLIEPENTGAMFQLAQLHMADGDTATAKKWCELALFWRPEKVSVLKIASECFLRANEPARAETILRKLVSIEPSDTRAWFNLSLCHRAHQNPEAQILALKEVLARKPDDGDALYFLIQAHVDLLRMDEAIAISERLEKVPGWEVVGVSKRAQLLALEGNGLVGYVLLNKALERHERSALLWFSMAVILAPQASYRQQALNAAENAMLCYKENPKQLSPPDFKALSQLLKELSGAA